MNIRNLLFILLLISPLSLFGKVEKISYRGWANCYKISNDVVYIIINASAGGRLSAYARNGTNIIYENSSQDGKMLSDYESKWFDPDGGRFDYGPEKQTRNTHNVTYMGEYEATIIDDYSLEISVRDENLGIETTRLFTLNPASSKLQVVQTMKNIANVETSYWFWGRTLVPVGGKLFSPINKNSVLPDKWGRYIWGDPLTFASDTDDSGVEIIDSLFVLTPSMADNAKYGTDGQSGWMAYGINGLLMVKTYPYYPDSTYGEKFDLTTIFYTNKNQFAEMEPFSPVANLSPGESYSYAEEWYLFEYGQTNNISFDVNAATVFIHSQLNPEINNTGYPFSARVNDSMKAYPNPATDETRIVFNPAVQSPLEVCLYDNSGKRYHVNYNNTSDSSVVISLEQLDPGYYLIVLQSGSKIRRTGILVY